MAADKPTKTIARRVADTTSPTLAGGDLCQAYEHLGRFEILEGGLSGADFTEVNLLANLAQQQIDSGNGKNATHLLRAAEHLSFAALAPKHSAQLLSRIPPELKTAVATELDRLTQRAEEEWAQSQNAGTRAVIQSTYLNALDRARGAFVNGEYRPALQFARAAEALSQIGEGLPSSIPGDRELTRRIAS